ncbi:hypothetical protein ACFYXQ_32380 [Nocardia jiangxiensis]|uniref:ESX-1 secretion-associated protein EspA/EspE-like domain-containing protein n=1 Tax=Nocardia jiangxiensis TaxID=282685 RepID=A0ABW6S863_9NOCA
MTTIDVQPSIYYTAASALHTSAVNLYNAFNNRADALDNHQLADWNATIGTKGPAPVKPADPLPAVLSCRKPPPSAGGPGNGLSDAIHLAEKVGIVIPDGDLDKLASIAGTWTAMHTDRAISGLADGIGRIISSVSLVKSPEAAQVVEDLQGMKLSASTITDGCNEIAKSCQTHHDDLHRLREQLQKSSRSWRKNWPCRSVSRSSSARSPTA